MKHFIVTGASRGVGFEVVRFLASEGEGRRIIALARTSEVLERCKAVSDRPERDNHMLPLTFDLMQEDYGPLKEAIENFCGGRIDGVLNNAGKLENKLFTELTDDDWYHIYKVNVFGVAKLTRFVLPYIKQGHVVNVSSMGGIQGSVKFPGLSAYSSSKAAVIGLTECLAEEYKESAIRFNCLAFGSVQTQMLEEAFPGFKAAVTAEEVGAYTARFVTEGGQFFNGKTLEVSSSTP